MELTYSALRSTSTSLNFVVASVEGVQERYQEGKHRDMGNASERPTRFSFDRDHPETLKVCLTIYAHQLL